MGLSHPTKQVYSVCLLHRLGQEYAPRISRPQDGREMRENMHWRICHDVILSTVLFSSMVLQFPAKDYSLRVVYSKMQEALQALHYLSLPLEQRSHQSILQLFQLGSFNGFVLVYRHTLNASSCPVFGWDRRGGIRIRVPMIDLTSDAKANGPDELE